MPMLKKSRFFYSFAFIFILFVGALSIYGIMGSLYKAELNSDDLEMAINIYKAKIYNLDRTYQIDLIINERLENRIDDKIQKEIQTFEESIKQGKEIDVSIYDSENVSYSLVDVELFNDYVEEHFELSDQKGNSGSFYYNANPLIKKIYYEYISSTRTFLFAEVNLSLFIEELRSVYTHSEVVTDYPFYILNQDLELIYAEGEEGIKHIEFAKAKILENGEKTIEKGSPLHYTIDSVNLIIGSEEDFGGYYCVEVERPELSSSIFMHTISILSITTLILFGVVVFLLQKGLF